MPNLKTRSFFLLSSSGRRPKLLVAAMVAVISVLGLSLLLMTRANTLPAGVRWNGDFQTGNLSQWTRSHVARSNAITVVTSPTRPGYKYAAKVTAQKGDHTFGSRTEDRAEVLTIKANSGSIEGNTAWYGWSMLLPQGTALDPGNWLIFTQWHQDYDGCPPNMALHLSSDAAPRARLVVRGGSLGTSPCRFGSSKVYDLGPMPVGSWTDIVMGVKWSSSSSGSVTVKFNGKTVLAPTNTPNLFHGQGAYLKQGIYRGASARTHTFYYTGTRQGSTEASVALAGTAPAPAPAPGPAPAPTPSPTPPLAAGTSVDDKNFTYAGTWSTSTGGGTYLGGDHFSRAKDSTFSLNFTGTQASLYASKDPRHGILAVSVDGGPETMVELYSATRADQAKVWTSPTLSSGTHTIRGRVTGQKNASASDVIVNADRIDYTPTSAVAPMKGDLNQDGRVDIQDLSRLLSEWGTADAAADLNGDKTVGITDLSILLSGWTK